MRNAWVIRVGMVTLVGVMVLSDGHLSTAAPNGIEPSATEAVESAVIDLKRVLNDDALKQPGRAKERRYEIEVPVEGFHRFPFLAVMALPAFEAEGLLRKAEIHSPVSTRRSRSTPVLMPRPWSM